MRAASRRLLLSGTPLQNDLLELWSLLNLLLPNIFDDRKVFAEWFGEAIASTAPGGGGASSSAEANWLHDKRVVVVNRLHQILEPFMLRRQVGGCARVTRPGLGAPLPRLGRPVAQRAA